MPEDMAAFRTRAWVCFKSAFLVLLLCSCGSNAPSGAAGESSTTNQSQQASTGRAERVREPAVAGLFYPGDREVLGRMVDSLLEKAPSHYIPRLKALVCPHAGYSFSGPVAAAGYKTLVGRPFDTVIVLGPSHYAAFEGACLPDAEAYRTPLGLVPLSEKVKILAATKPFVLEPRCLVQRPGWWSQAPKAAPAAGQDTPETWEHSVEVQVPFLQRAGKNFKLLPMVLGEVEPEEVARGLASVMDEKTILVASSDLSHYHAYTAAKALDDQCVRAICSVDLERMKKQEACGKSPILALLHLAKLKGWKTQLLDSRNSGDVSGEKDRVVGYTSVAFYAPGQEEFDAPDRAFLLGLARKSLARAVTNAEPPDLKEVSPKFSAKRACFVTLTKGGELRGCIGHILPQVPLWQAVVDNARNAALRDPRFPPVQPKELADLKIEISVLTEPQPLAFNSPEDLLSKLQPYADGVLLRMGIRTATFLPQVWAQVPDKVEFLNHLAQKAGCSASAWREPGTSVSIYHVECFEETAAAAVRN